jgi:hypothetical protein
MPGHAPTCRAVPSEPQRRISSALPQSTVFAGEQPDVEGEVVPVLLGAGAGTVAGELLQAQANAAAEHT